MLLCVVLGVILLVLVESEPGAADLFDVAPRFLDLDVVLDALEFGLFVGAMALIIDLAEAALFLAVEAGAAARNW